MFAANTHLVGTKFSRAFLDWLSWFILVLRSSAATISKNELPDDSWREQIDFEIAGAPEFSKESENPED